MLFGDIPHGIASDTGRRQSFRKHLSNPEIVVVEPKARGLNSVDHTLEVVRDGLHRALCQLSVGLVEDATRVFFVPNCLVYLHRPFEHFDVMH